MSYSKIENKALKIVLPVAEELGYSIYDVAYVKEGPHWFLRIFIDRENGVSMDDCETISRKLSDLFDQNNILDNNYFLEVSSKGLERVLRQDKHFTDATGEVVNVKFFKPILGSKEIEGELISANDTEIIVKTPQNEITIEKINISKINVVFDFS